MKQRYVAYISYDGSKFAGFNKQPNVTNTVQGLLEANLYQLFKTSVKVTGAGRTDKGVHAFCLPVHFDLPADLVLKKSLHSLLTKYQNQAVFWKQISKVNNNFHTRFDCKWKEYYYFVKTSAIHPQDLNYYYCLNNNLIISQLASFNRYLQHYCNVYDFVDFCYQPQQYYFCLRLIKMFKVFVYNEHICFFKVLAPSFMQQMVRLLVGKTLKDFFHLNIKKLAPASGLYFNRAYY